MRVHFSENDDVQTVAAKLERAIRIRERNRRPADASNLRTLLAAVKIMGRIDAQIQAKHSPNAALDYGRVLAVPNGHSLLVRRSDIPDTDPIRIRLYGVRAPGAEDPFGADARAWMARNNRRIVHWETVRIDIFRRHIAIVREPDSDGRPGERSMQAALLARGLARIDERHCGRAICHRWRVLAKRARREGRGIWNS